MNHSYPLIVYIYISIYSTSIGIDICGIVHACVCDIYRYIHTHTIRYIMRVCFHIVCGYMPECMWMYSIVCCDTVYSSYPTLPGLQELQSGSGHKLMHNPTID